MALKEYEPTDGISRTRDGWIPKATHGAALLLGVLAWHALLGDPAPDVAEPTEAARQLQHLEPTAQSAAWIDASLAKMRSLENANAAANNPPPTIEKFLKLLRQEWEEGWQEEDRELDQIVAKARSMHAISDPAAALLAALRNKSDDRWVIFQHWLDTNPDAALAEVGRNQHLLDVSYLPALLERKFGIEGMKSMIANEQTSYRLRTALAAQLGRQAAHGTGLESLIKYYNSIADPKLKLRMTEEFANEWPLDEPESVARILVNEAPKDLRKMLLQKWKFSYSGPESGEVMWLKDLYPRLGLEEFEYSDPESGHGGWSEESSKRWEARQSMAFDEVVQDYMKEGISHKDAVKEAIEIKLNQAMENGPDLIELFGEGQLTRAELLDELRRKVPESNAHPIALERQAWKMTAWTADPQELARWTVELSSNGDMDELLYQIFTPGNLYGDPRIPLRLERYRIVSQGIKNDISRNSVLRAAAWEWTRWQAVSPPAAEAWRDGLPKTEPLYDAIRSEEKIQLQIKQNL